MPDRSKELAALWLGLVDTDVAVARKVLPDLVDPAAFHVQQAIEKALKAAIILSGGEPPKTHDLKRLHALTDGGLTWSEAEDWLDQRTEWNAATRYRVTDVAIHPTSEEVEQSLESVERLLDELRSKLD